MNPERELRVAGSVGRAGDRSVELVQAADLGARRRRRPVDDPEIAAERSLKPGPRVGSEVGVVGDARGDLGMGELHEQRPWPGAEEEHRLAVQRPRLRSRTIEPPRVGVAARIDWGRRAI